jgi:hypothetical protein
MMIVNVGRKTDANVAIIYGKWPIQGRGAVSVEEIKLPKHATSSLLFHRW